MHLVCTLLKLEKNRANIGFFMFWYFVSQFSGIAEFFYSVTGQHGRNSRPKNNQSDPVLGKGRFESRDRRFEIDHSD